MIVHWSPLLPRNERKPYLVTLALTVEPAWHEWAPPRACRVVRIAFSRLVNLHNYANGPDLATVQPYDPPIATADIKGGFSFGPMLQPPGRISLLLSTEPAGEVEMVVEVLEAP